MKEFQAVYVPVGAPTFHLESARAEFEKTVGLLKELDPNTLCPEDTLFSPDAAGAFLDGAAPDLIVFQDVTFANGAYVQEVLRRFEGTPILLWTVREPVIDGALKKFYGFFVIQFFIKIAVFRSLNISFIFIIIAKCL